VPPNEKEISHGRGRGKLRVAPNSTSKIRRASNPADLYLPLWALATLLGILDPPAMLRPLLLPGGGAGQRTPGIGP